jgi:hypothetical protein
MRKWAGRKGPWRNWFAWYPVRLGLHGRIVWLSHVKRRFVTCHVCDGFSLAETYRWEYRK